MTVHKLRWGFGDDFERIYRAMEDHLTFDHKGLLSRKVDLEYDLTSNQPFVYFNCRADERLSFRAHDLELGPMETSFWHISAQEGKTARLEGFVPLISLSHSSARGYLSVDDSKKYHKTGVVVRNGRVLRVRPHQDIMEDLSFFSGILSFYFMSKMNTRTEKRRS